MKIALLHYAAPPVVGGVETVLAKQAEWLTRYGHQVRILTGRGQTWDPRIPVEVIPVLDSKHPDILQIKASLDSGYVPAEFSRMAERILMSLRTSLAGVDVLIVHNVASLHKNLPLTAAVHDLSQIPGSPRTILWHHDPAWTTPRYAEELHPGYPWDLLRTAWKGITQVTISAARQEELAKLFQVSPTQIHVIPGGVDLPEFLCLGPHTRLMVEKLDIATCAPLMLTPVRITRRKNLELALRILENLRQHLPDAVLVITGPLGAHNPSNEEYFNDLLRLRSRLHLEGAVHFLAEMKPEGLSTSEVADFYRLADALLLPSREEGFGIPILEAGLGRLPIFCSDIPSLRALGGSYATYFNPDDSPEQISRQIVNRLSRDSAYQLRTQVRTAYTWQSICEQRILPLLEKA